MGLTDRFNWKDFSNTTLKTVPQLQRPGFTGPNNKARTVSWYPCTKMCRVLLPLFGVPANLPSPSAYDTDLVAAEVDPW